ncbi:MAG: LCP family protein [Anaerolineales bacterium]|nr:LCP family protein [Anaerolineales bacterium]
MKFERPSIRTIIFWIVVLIVAVGAFIGVRNLAACWIITPLPGLPPADCGTVSAGLNGPSLVNSEGTPVPGPENLPPPVIVPESDLPPAWDGASRITVLILGLDARDTDTSAPRSDTMILLTIDPLTKTAGMLSIPRDMWVNIPGFGYSRINTAYSSGEGNKLPGGGPELARKTVEQFIGVPVQYYAQVDFNTFVQFIDRIGGIDIYNDEKLRLDPIGPGQKIILTCCGMRHLSGEKALAYARHRKGDDGDFGRARRQQKVIIGIRDKALDPANFPSLIAQADDFYNEFSAGIRTNMPLETAIQLAALAKDIPVSSIEQGLIDPSMVAFDNVILGGQDAAIMKPLPDKIRELRDEIFTSAGALSPLAAGGDLTALMQADGARVRLLNGTFTPNLEVNTGNYFIAQSMAVTEVAPAERAYDRTVIVLHSPKLYTLKYLQSVFGITSNTQIIIRPDPASTVDVEVYLGNDWANNNPIP